MAQSYGQCRRRESAHCLQKTLPRSWYSFRTWDRSGVSWAGAEAPEEGVTAKRRQLVWQATLRPHSQTEGCVGLVLQYGLGPLCRSPREKINDDGNPCRVAGVGEGLEVEN